MQSASLQHIAHLMQIPSPVQQLISGVSVDSRLTTNEDIFFALPGALVDGHNFLPEAAAKGAFAAVVKANYSGPSHGLHLLRSHDVLASLQIFAHNYIKQSPVKIVAITGSVGKTTTKDFITTLLKSKYKVSSSPGNSNSQIGLPLALLNHAQLENDFIILEMGMTEPGQITKLVQIAPPFISIMTSIALVHACNFDSIEDIARAKAEIFSHPNTELGIYPKEYDFGIFSRAGLSKKLTFSTQDLTADYSLKTDQDKMIISCLDGKQHYLPLLNLPGNHNQHNFLAAATAAHHLGMSWEEISSSQEKLCLPERRMHITEKNGMIFVNDSYNACEASVNAALNSLPIPKRSGKKIAVIGEMLELGKFSEQCHLSVGTHALNCVDSMVCFGKECYPIYTLWQKTGREVFWTEERNALIEHLRTKLKADDVILLKGSRSKGLWKILEEI